MFKNLLGLGHIPCKLQADKTENYILDVVFRALMLLWQNLLGLRGLFGAALMLVFVFFFLAITF